MGKIWLLSSAAALLVSRWWWWYDCECDYISTNSLTRNLIAIPLGYLKVGLCGWEDINFDTAKLRIFSLHTCTLSFSSLLIESIVKYLSDSINLDISSPHSQTGKPRWEMCAHHTALSRLPLCVDTPENQWEMWKMSNKFSVSHHKQSAVACCEWLVAEIFKTGGLWRESQSAHRH